jgi:alkaline phosphatase D
MSIARRWLLALVLVALPVPAAASEPLRRIAFGSCASQERPQPIWDAIIAAKPELFLFLGNTIYADTDNVEVLKAKYSQLAAVPGYQKLLQTCPLVYATWDDHDYGTPDAGADFPNKAASQKTFLDFFREAAESPRRKREGMYVALQFGTEGRRVQIILLDTRYFRSPLKRTAEGLVATTDPAATVLGEKQWKWLEEQLRLPADVRLIGSSIQVVAEDHPFEKWMNFPAERERLFKLLRDTKATGVVFLSGNRQLAELSQMDAGLGYPLFDLTSSGLNMGNRRWRPVEPNRHRVATMTNGDNFGMVTIDWDGSPPHVSLQAHDVTGEIAFQQKLDLTTLRPGSLKPSTGAVAKTDGGPSSTGPTAGTVGPSEAAKMVGQKVTLEMKVNATGSATNGSRAFLNSAANYREPGNFTVVLDMRVLADKLKAAGIDEPLVHYRGKTVRVNGTVSMFNDRPQIVVEDVGQISIVDK